MSSDLFTILCQRMYYGNRVPQERPSQSEDSGRQSPLDCLYSDDMYIFWSPASSSHSLADDVLSRLYRLSEPAVTLEQLTCEGVLVHHLGTDIS